MTCDFTKLQDGLLVTQNAHVKAIKMEYEVLIVLTPPTWPDAMTHAVERLRLEVDSLLGQAYLTSKDRSLWLKRLELLKPKLSKPRRVKRGFFDLGGKLLKSVFGVATSEDIKRVGTILQTASKEQSKIIHRVNDLLTIVNRTNDNVQQDRERINLIDSHVQEVSQWLTHLSDNMKNISDESKYMRQNILLDRAITQLERQAALLHQQEDMYKTQKLTLESERLTQDILSESELDVILKRVISRDTERITPLQWYYEYCVVEPIWTQKYLAYRVVLPLVARNNFTSYYLQSFPEVTNTSEVSTQLMVKDAYAEDMVTGNQLYPYDCRGHNPVVCKNNVRLIRQESCEKAIIRGHRDDYALCQVKMEHFTGVRIPVQVRRGEYVYPSAGEYIQVRCEGQTPHSMLIQRGTYLIKVEQGCLYEGQSWRLFGIRQVQDQVTLSFQILTVPRIDMNDIVKSHVDIFHSKFGTRKQLGHVQMIKLKPLAKVGYDIASIADLITDNVSIFDICNVFMLLPLYVLLIYMIYAKCCRVKKTYSDEPKVTASLDPNDENDLLVKIHPQISDTECMYPKFEWRARECGMNDVEYKEVSVDLEK